MNIISWEKAYRLYPKATLEKRRTLLCEYWSTRDRGLMRDIGASVALKKSVNRGFTLDRAHREKTSLDALYSLDTTRWLDDRYSWTITLPRTGMKLPEDSLGYDPVSMSSFKLVRCEDIPVSGEYDFVDPGYDRFRDSYRHKHPFVDVEPDSTLFADGDNLRYIYLVADADSIINARKLLSRTRQAQEGGAGQLDTTDKLDKQLAVFLRQQRT
jgi:hypothetical protein